MESDLKRSLTPTKENFSCVEGGDTQTIGCHGTEIWYQYQGT